MGDGMAKVIFVTGGSRSGKTSFALMEGAKAAGGGRKVYIATAQALDAEMADRIDKHKLERGSAWETVEEPIHLDRALRECGPAPVVVIDCLTLWLSNLLCAISCRRGGAGRAGCGPGCVRRAGLYLHRIERSRHGHSA